MGTKMRLDTLTHQEDQEGRHGRLDNPFLDQHNNLKKTLKIKDKLIITNIQTIPRSNKIKFQLNL